MCALKNSVAIIMQVGEVGHCLRVDAMRGENLPRLDVTGASDPYALVTAQSEAGLQMFRTKTIWSTTVRLPQPALLFLFTPIVNNVVVWYQSVMYEKKVM
jgi:hypothetical protein